MHKISAKLIHSLIEKTVGKGPHYLHEPSFSVKEIRYINNTIKKILFQVREFTEIDSKKRLKDILKLNT